MHSYNTAFYELKQQLQPIYDDREAAAIAHEVLFYVTGLDKTQRLMQKDTMLTEEQAEKYVAAARELLAGKPLQYVTCSAWFMGREFYVDDNVLIPRPETEELVQWIISGIAHPVSPLKIIDIGTGSGCISISLKLGLPGCVITACDISKGALGVAQRNAVNLGADVLFEEFDFLNAEQRNKLANYDVIVSNPPYIPEKDRATIHANVKDHEPAIALFVPDDDALLFYRAIGEFGKGHLNSNGYIYCELDAAHAMECKTLFEEMGYTDVEIRKDMHGNWRMLKAGF